MYLQKIILIFLLLNAFFFSRDILAGVEFKEFTNTEQEQIYNSLVSELRCLVCQNQTIADSNADLAKDLRMKVYQMLQQGKTKQDIIDFMTQRYGDFVLYRPPLKAKTSLLWFAPVLFFLFGLLLLWSFIRKRKKTNAVVDQTVVDKIKNLMEQGDES